jgi:dTDP-4-dehydrorhamnose 3,5-epimerase
VEHRETAVMGCFELDLPSSRDHRGSFTKLFQSTEFARASLPLTVRELFVSSSGRNVLRGLHFQLPPLDLAKLVVCLSGRVVDAVVDLRTDSPTYREHALIELDAEQHRGVMVPLGCAHGFLVVSDQALMAYAVSEEYDPELDAGILWSSADIAWPTTDPIVSDRDASFVTLDAFESPFSIGAPA